MQREKSVFLLQESPALLLVIVKGKKDNSHRLMDTDTSAPTITGGNPKRGDSMIDTMHMSFLHPSYPSWRPIRRLSFFIDTLLLSTWKRGVAQFWAESTQHWTFSPSSHPFISSAITYSPSHSAVLCITLALIAQGKEKHWRCLPARHFFRASLGA